MISFYLLQLLPRPILDIVVDDEIQLLRRKPVVLRQHLVDLADGEVGFTQLIDSLSVSFS